MKLRILLAVLLITWLCATLSAQTAREYPLVLKDDWDHPNKIFVPLTVKCNPPLQPYVISIPGALNHWETCGSSRTNALMSLSPTVWTKEEWDEAAEQEKKFPIAIAKP